MNAHTIIVICKVCETGSVTGAAKLLYLTPQAVSLIIKKTEKELGISLFSRSPEGMVMTEYGKLFYEEGQDLAKRLKKFEALFRKDIHNLHGELNVSMLPEISSFLGIRIFDDFIRSYPNFQIAFSEETDQMVCSMVNDEKADIGIVSSAVISENLDLIPLKSYPCCAVISVNSDIGRCMQGACAISIQDLAEESLIIPNKKNGLYHEFKRLCHEQKICPKICFETSDSAAAIQIAGKEGITAIAPLPVAMETVRPEKQFILPFRENFTWDLYFVKKKNVLLSEIENELILHLKNQV